jgi:hypothetical protein
MRAGRSVTALFRDSITLDIQKDAIIEIPMPVPLRITCIAGAVWLTEHLSTVDIVLETGETHTFSRRQRIVLEGLRRARLHLETMTDCGVWRPSLLDAIKCRIFGCR